MVMSKSSNFYVYGYLKQTSCKILGNTMNECLKLHRISYRLATGGYLSRAFSAFVRHVNQAVFSCHIGSGAIIGEHCILQHNGLGVVISEHASIGDSCMIYQHVTLGAIQDGSSDAPVLESNVIVGAGATILGKVHVYSGAKIGAGAVVLEDVPAGATAIGVPARILTRTDRDQTDSAKHQIESRTTS